MRRPKRPKVKVRRAWGRSPVTRVVRDRTKYERSRARQEERREREEN